MLMFTSNKMYFFNTSKFCINTCSYRTLVKYYILYYMFILFSNISIYSTFNISNLNLHIDLELVNEKNI